MRPPTSQADRRSPAARARDARLSSAIERWFAMHARDLPWRRVTASGGRDPYRAMVSEFMLQQTQVSRVVPAFDRFVGLFPDVRALAGASIEDVMRAWEGLGYYRRAGLLHRAAVAIVERHGGVVPSEVEALRSIPGIGAYTAGSVASIVFGVRTPIVDANVRRVVLRIEGRAREESDAARDGWVWGRAARLVEGATSPGVFNEGVMELGAVHCLPRGPVCQGCPVASECRARARGVQDRIPGPVRRAVRTEVVHQVVVIRDRAGRVAVEQRAQQGMWAGLWQFPTREGPVPGVSEADLAAWAGVRRVRAVGEFARTTTHRAVRFQVWIAGAGGASGRGRWRWVVPSEASELAFSVPHRVIQTRFARAVWGEDLARS